MVNITQKIMLAVFIPVLFLLLVMKTEKVHCGKMNTSTFDEEYVLGELLKSSKVFRDFYETERGKIKKSVYWSSGEPLPPGIDRMRESSTTEHRIFLRPIPASPEDAIGVAHELVHLIMDDEGFPVVVYQDLKFRNICATINSMLHDPIVNARLRDHGFDILEHYESQKKEMVSYLKMNQDSLSDTSTRTGWVFNFASILLEREVALRGQSKAKDSLPAWLEAEHPDISKEMQDLINLVSRIGYDTPEKQHRLYDVIIQRYRLQRHLSVKTPR